MKKLLFFIAVIFYTVVSVQQALSQSPDQLTAWENFKTTFGNDWRIAWDANGTPRTIVGGKNFPPTGEPKATAILFLTQLKDVFGFTNLEQNLPFSNSVPTQVDSFIYHQVHFQPQINGIPVLDAGITVYINKKGQIYLVNATAYKFSAPFDNATPLLTSEAAKAIALLNIEQPVVLDGEIMTQLGYVYMNDSYILVWRVRIPTLQPFHNWQLDIGQDGTVINKTDLIVYATGTARVYLHHPLVGDTVRQTLYNLYDTSCYVLGTYADAYNLEGARACDSNWQFIYDTSDARFDEGNAYYHVQFLVERFVSMGLPMQPRIRAEVRAEIFGAGFSPGVPSSPDSGGAIILSRGGEDSLYFWRDAAKEEAAIYHEYGHLLVDRLIEPPNVYWFANTREGFAMTEGLPDYFAYSASDDPLLPEWTVPQLTRTAENNLTYDSLCCGQYHNAQMISGALWNMRNLMLQINEGIHPDKLVWLALDISHQPDSFKHFHSRLVLADRDYGNSDNLRDIHFGFIPKGIRPDTVVLTPPTNPNVFTPYFSPDPGTVFEGNCYVLYADATQNGNPAATLDYFWTSKYVTIPMSAPIDVIVSYCPPVINQTRVDSIWVKVYDGLGGVDSALKVVTIYRVPGGSGCPYLYNWDGKEFVQDNTILTQSEFNFTSGSVTDLYQLTQPLVEKDGEYLLQLREFEKEETELDQVELITVDYPSTVNVGVTPEGKIMAYDKALLPISAVDNEGKDQLELIVSRDEKPFKANGPGYLLLTFKNPKNEEISDKLKEMNPPEPGAPPIHKRIGVNSRLIVEIEDSQGDWHTLGDIAPRANVDRSYWVLGTNDVELGEQVRVKLSWSLDYEADWLGFVLPTEQTYYQESIGLKGAVHSKNGEVAPTIAVADGNSAKLVPGESINLKFPISSPKPEGMVRDFFFKALGYYKKYDKDSNTGVLSYKLYSNYPNPFNAVTEIQYALPEASEVNLSVYNIMGQKVRILVEGRQSAGVHKVIWDGNNKKGEAVASGVYFYSIRAGTYIETKKMTLLK